jgi:hypothetical protein
MGRHQAVDKPEGSYLKSVLLWLKDTGAGLPFRFGRLEPLLNLLGIIPQEGLPLRQIGEAR